MIPEMRPGATRVVFIAALLVMFVSPALWGDERPVPPPVINAEIKSPPANLWQAAELGDVEAIKKFITAGARVDEADDAKQWTPLIYAVRYNRVQAVKALLSANANPLKFSGKGSAPIGFAAQYGHVEIIKILGAKGADLEACKAPFYVPLAYAASNGHLEAIDALLEAGVNIDAGDQSGRTALMIAAGTGQVQSIRKLIGRGADVNHHSQEGLTPAVMAAYNGKLDALKALAEHGADLRYPGVIHQAADQGHGDVVLYLVDSGVNVNSRTNYRSTPLSTACARGDAKLMQELMKRGALWHRLDDGLAVAIEKGHAQCAMMALDLGARLGEEDHAELTEKILKRGDTEMAVVLLRIDRRIKKLKPSGDFVAEDDLVRASTAGDLARIEKITSTTKIQNAEVFKSAMALASHYKKDAALALLTKAGDDIVRAAQHRQQQAASLVLAAEKGHAKTVADMLAKGVPPDALDRPGGHDAMCQAREGPERVEISRLLLEKGYPPNGGRGMIYPTIRSAAIDKKNGVELARLFLKHGADPNLTWDNIYPLECFASDGSVEGVRLLLDAKARINQRGYEGRTALFAAAEVGAADVVKLLIDRGADLNIPNKDGAAPLAAAQANGHDGVIKLLKAAGATERPGAVAAAQRNILIDAMTKGPREIERLIKLGADPKQFDARLMTDPLQHAVTWAGVSDPQQRVAIAKVLLDNGVDPRDYPGILVSVIYARTTDKDKGMALLQLLIDRGANVNDGGNWVSGYTPLIMAAERGNTPAVQLLIDKGASSEARKDTGETPLDLAIKKGYKEAAAILERDAFEWRLRRGGQ
jgi:ankyrin repeat protein